MASQDERSASIKYHDRMPLEASAVIVRASSEALADYGWDERFEGYAGKNVDIIETVARRRNEKRPGSVSTNNLRVVVFDLDVLSPQASQFKQYFACVFNIPELTFSPIDDTSTSTSPLEWPPELGVVVKYEGMAPDQAEKSEAWCAVTKIVEGRICDDFDKALVDLRVEAEHGDASVWP